jgi:hypothetical protein
MRAPVARLCHAVLIHSHRDGKAGKHAWTFHSTQSPGLDPIEDRRARWRRQHPVKRKEKEEVGYVHSNGNHALSGETEIPARLPGHGKGNR